MDAAVVSDEGVGVFMVGVLVVYVGLMVFLRRSRSGTIPGN